MIKMSVLLVLLSIGLSPVYAGWYQCYNFKGSIDKYPVTFSIQVKPGYFGEKEKKHYNIIGVYKYDNHNQPIRLEGKIDFTTNKALLYEINNNRYTASFTFDFSVTSITGTWKNLHNNSTLPLTLQYVSQLVDTAESDQFSGIEILQAASLKDFYFTGLYTKKAGDDRAQMTELNIINKKDNTVFQAIDLLLVETQTGNVATILFDNVYITDDKAKKILVLNNTGRVGGYVIIYFDPKTKKFVLNPEPIAEGPQ
jgi:hypothetical protein